MFEKLEKRMTMLGNSMKSGASNFTENISLNAKIDDAKKKIEVLFGEIGEKFYTENKEAVPAGYEEAFGQIGGYFKEIDDCADQLKKLAGIRPCPNCGADVAKGYRFCIMCGTQMPEEEKPKNPVCEVCGTEGEEGAIFCINCGARLVKKEKKKEKFCSRCGAKLVEGAAFCTTCGQKVNREEEKIVWEPVPAEEPAQMPAAEPTQSFAAEPTQSFAAEPTQSIEAEPTQTFAAEPTQSIEAEPTQTFAAEPTQTFAAEPVQFSAEAPVEEPAGKEHPDQIPLE